MSPIKYFSLTGNPSTPKGTMIKNINRIVNIYRKHTCLYKVHNKTQMQIILSAILASAFTGFGFYIPQSTYGQAILRIPSSTNQFPRLNAFKVFIQAIRPKYLRSSPNIFPKIRDISDDKIWSAKRVIYKATTQLQKGGINIPPIYNTKKAVRGFALLSKFTNNPHASKSLQYNWPIIPQRSTNGSAGYDIRSNETITIPSIPRAILRHRNIEKATTPTMVKTGLKAYMPKNEVLYIYNRSSNPGKRGLYLANGVGVVDSDYYDNRENEGELLIALINLSVHNYTIHRGDRIAQGVFGQYRRADIDMPMSNKRVGGFGSTGKK